MTSLRTKLQQYTLLMSLLAAFSAWAVSGAPSSLPSLVKCSSEQCIRFFNWGFSMDVALRAGYIQQLMKITKLERPDLTEQSFMDSIISNWGPHLASNQYSEHSAEIFEILKNLGMYKVYNQLSEYTLTSGKLYIIILGSNPDQLCSILGELKEFRGRVHQTFLIGSTTPAFEKQDYLDCFALNSQQRQDLTDLSTRKELVSEQDVMSYYFDLDNLNAAIPSMDDNSKEEAVVSFRNTQLMKKFLKPNNPIKRTRSSVIIAAPQPYMLEAETILKDQMKNSSIYRLSSQSHFNIYESLNALRSWLQTDHSSKH